MEIGRVAQIDNAKQNNIEKAQKVSTIEEKNKTIQDEEYKKNSNILPDTELNEVIIDNVRFGYNKESKDFFVKITRGDIENKYPTEDMMKIKAFLIEELEKSIKNFPSLFVCSAAIRFLITIVHILVLLFVQSLQVERSFLLNI